MNTIHVCTLSKGDTSLFVTCLSPVHGLWLHLSHTTRASGVRGHKELGGQRNAAMCLLTAVKNSNTRRNTPASWSIRHSPHVAYYLIALPYLTPSHHTYLLPNVFVSLKSSVLSTNMTHLTFSFPTKKPIVNKA